MKAKPINAAIISHQGSWLSIRRGMGGQVNAPWPGPVFADDPRSDYPPAARRSRVQDRRIALPILS
jgi:hypothetical protein